MLQEYITRDFSEDEFEVWQYPVYAAIGVLCGFLGPLYINFRLHMLKVWEHSVTLFFTGRGFLCLHQFGE